MLLKKRAFIFSMLECTIIHEKKVTETIIFLGSVVIGVGDRKREGEGKEKI